MKPIEKGCRAKIVNSTAGNDGIIVTVGEFIGKLPKMAGENRWAVDKPMAVKGVDSGILKPFISYSAEEFQLQRIDDDDVALGSWGG